MRILLISSSPHKVKSQTFILAKEVLNGCSCYEGIDCEVMHLCGLKIEFCKHCEACHKKILSCPIKDDTHMILQKMIEADGIIIASPNYINQVTASMKALFERGSHFIHCKRLLDKYIVGVVSSGSGRDEDVLGYIKYYSNICGAQYAGGVSSVAAVSKQKLEEAFKLGKKLFLDIKEKKEFSGQKKDIERGRQYFKKIIEMRKNDWVEEYQYWQRKGWV